MENIVGTVVWVVEYDYADLKDCNGVFSTKEKALASINTDFENYKDIWRNRELIDEDEINSDWITWEFDLVDCDYFFYKHASVSLYCTIIQ